MCRLIDDSRVNPLIALANKSPKTRTGSSRSETPAALAHVHNTVPVSFTTRVGKGAKRPTPDSNYFCDGLAEEIIGGLTKVPGIRPSNHRPLTCARQTFICCSASHSNWSGVLRAQSGPQVAS
jgi:hypothetical protein